VQTPVTKKGRSSRTHALREQNAILAVSLAVAKAGAAAKGVPLYKHFADLAGNTGKLVMPVPWMNVINGGSHAGNRLAMQEFMIGATGASSFREAVRMTAEVGREKKSVICESCHRHGNTIHPHSCKLHVTLMKHEGELDLQRHMKSCIVMHAEMCERNFLCRNCLSLHEVPPA
jgi:hypothetical protein